MPSQKRPDTTEPLLVLKPSVINALLPTFLRILLFFAIVFFLVAAFAAGLVSFGFLQESLSIVSWVTLSLLATFLSLSVRLFIHANTTYSFYAAHLDVEFRFLIIRKRSVLYTKITNTTLVVSIWDRICNAGDLVLHTADDDTNDFTLHYLKDAQEVERRIYELLEKERAGAETTQRRLQKSGS